MAVFTKEISRFKKKTTILKYKFVKGWEGGGEKVASIKKVLLCPMVHLRQFTYGHAFQF